MTQPAARILIADDQPHVLEALRVLLRAEGFRVHAVASPSEVLHEVRSGEFDALLIDANYTRDTTSGAEGLALLEQIQAIDSALPVILMTAWGSVELAVAAMRHGARDFIQKPWENARLLAVLRNQVDFHISRKRMRLLEAENALLRTGERRPPLIASSPVMQPLLELLTRIAPSDANVLITGEHGTGKEVFAQTIHALSSRSDKTLIAVNTGALSEGTFESEIFGHVRGAFTDARADRVGRFELADRGTLFLDEIANVPLHQQGKLLRVLETGALERVGSSRTTTVDVRVISATNANVAERAAEGTFRPDLLFRLNTVELHIPSLRERRADIAPLAAHFLAHHSSRYRRPISGFTPAALHLLQQHGWPGNVRELNHTIERAVLLAHSTLIEASDLGLQPALAKDASLNDLSLEAVEGILVRKALARADGNVSRAAEMLGLSRGALYRRMEKHGIADT